MSQFKKPASCIDQSSKFASVPKFSIDESVIEHVDASTMKKEDNSRQLGADQHATVDNHGAGLSVIMEATREYNRLVLYFIISHVFFIEDILEVIY